MAFVSLLLVVFSAFTAKAEDTVYSVVPADWLTENAEYSSFTGQPSREYPEAPTVSEFKEDLTITNRYLFSLAFDRVDEGKLFLAFDSGEISKLDHKTGQMVWTTKLADTAETFAMSSDGTRLALGSLNDKVFLVDAQSGAKVREIPGVCSIYCTTVGFSSDGTLLVVGDANGFLSIVNLATYQVVWKNKVHDWPVRKVLVISSDQKTFLVSSDVSEVVLWDPDQAQPIRRLKGEHADGGASDFWVNSLSHIEQSGRFVIGGYTDVFIVDASTSETLKTYSGADQSIMQAHASKDLDRVLGISRDQVIYEWDTETGDVAATTWMKSTIWGSFFDSAISPSGNYTAVGSLEAVFGFPPKVYNKIKVYSTPLTPTRL